MRRKRFYAALAAIIIGTGLASTPAPFAYAGGLPMTKTANATRILIGIRVAGDFHATITYDDGTYSGTLTRQSSTLSVTTRQTVPVSYTWKSETPFPIDNGKGPGQATSPSTYSYTYNDTAAGQTVTVSLPRTRNNYFGGSVISQTFATFHNGYAFDPQYHSTLGYMSNNTVTYMGGYRYDETPRKPQDYYGPAGESGLGWTQVGRRWAGELQDATQEPWRSMCLEAYGIMRFDAESNGSDNRYRKPVWIDYERTAQSQYVYADYSGNVALKQTTITYTGTVTRRNSAPTVTMTNSPVEPNEGGSTTLTITVTDPDDDVLDTVVTWQPMGTNNVTPGTVTTLTDYPRASGSTFTLTRSSLADGYYKAVVTVTDPGGLKATKTLTVHVNGGPSITIATTPTEPNEPGLVTISVTPTDPDDSSVFLYTTIQPMGTNNATPGTETLIINSQRATGTAHTVTRSNLADGFYKITATATDAGGLERTVTKTFHVNGGPSVTFTTTPTEPNAGGSVTISVTPGDPDDSTVRLYATIQPMGLNNNTPGTVTPFFDSDRATGAPHSATRSGLAPGYHKIVATVTDAGGLTATTTKTIYVNSGPSVAISNAPTEPNAGGSTVVSVTPTDLDDANVQLYVTWQPMGVDNAMPGTATPIINSQRATGTAHTVTRSGLAAGYYKVTATATDAGGLTYTATRTIHVNGGPAVTISNSPIEPSAGGSTVVSVIPTDPDDANVLLYVTWQPMGVDNATPGTATAIINSQRDTGMAHLITRSGLTAGYYKVTATATDAGGLTATATRTIHVSPHPVDLAVTSLTADKSQYKPGETVTVSAVVANLGETTASNVVIRLTSSPSVGTQNKTVSIGAGKSTTVVYTFIAPSYTTATTIALTVTADATNIIAESNESNNTASRSIQVLPALPDLTITSLTTNASTYDGGDTITVTATVKNQGTADAAASTLKLAYGSSSVTKAVGAIAKGGTSTVTLTITAPVYSSNTTLTLTATADSAGVVTELDEINNTRSTSVMVLAAKPDLTITTMSTNKGSYVSGETVTVTVTVKNQGNTAAGSFVTRLVTNPATSTMDKTCSLAAGASTTFTYTFTVPISLTNTAMTLTATADATGVIVEQNESNNTKTASITINALQPDLTVISANTSDWYAGMEVLVSAKVSNLSSQPVPSVVVRLTAGSTTVNETIAVPGDDSNLAVFRFRVPSSPGTLSVSIKVDPDNLIGEVNESNNQLSESQATVAIPAPTFADPDEPTLESWFQQNNKTVPALPAVAPSNTHAWQEIRLEGGSYNLKNYWAQLSTTFTEAPDPRVARADKPGIMESGFGLTYTAKTTMTTNYDHPEKLVGPQMLWLFFPESAYGQDMQWPTLHENMTLQSCTSGSTSTITWEYPVNPVSTAGSCLHFTPLWYPDDTAYTTLAQAFYGWSPLGQMIDYTSSSVTIHGDMYDRITVVRMR